MSALQFEALKVALKQDASGYVLTIRIHPNEIPQELMRDFIGARYALAMVRINDDESFTQVRNRVQKAGILCRESWFHRFLDEVYDMTNTTESKAIRFLHDICGISSRTELNGNKEAQKAFDDLVEEYEQWSQKNDPF
jgi:hypothetical protein